MLKGLFSHTLTGRAGWSNCSITCIDPALVVNVHIRKRLFKIFDRDCAYTLTLKYAEPVQKTVVNYGFNTNGGLTFVPTSQTDLHQLITKRYVSLSDAQKEIAEIEKYQKMMRQYNEAIKNEILSKMNFYVNIKSGTNHSPGVNSNTNHTIN